MPGEQHPGERGQSDREVIIMIAFGLAALVGVSFAYTHWMSSGTPPKSQEALSAAVTPSAASFTNSATSTPILTTSARIATPTAAVATAPASRNTSPGTSVRLVPFGDFPQPLLNRLPVYFRDHCGIVLTVLPTIPVAASLVQTVRQQLIAERLIDTLAAKVRVNVAGGAVIGLTQRDMMIQGMPQWAFAFSDRDRSRDIGVVSTMRMDPRSYGLADDQELLFQRMAKMVAKHIGLLFLGLPPSSDPKSLMYNNVLSLADLDGMGGADLCPR